MKKSETSKRVLLLSLVCITYNRNVIGDSCCALYSFDLHVNESVCNACVDVNSISLTMNAHKYIAAFVCHNRLKLTRLF